MNKIPKGYTKEQWESYQNDPTSYCIKELKNSDSTVRYNAVDILRGLAFDAVEAIPALSETLMSDADVRAHTAFTLQEICIYVDVDKRKPAIDALIKQKEVEKESDAINEIEEALNTIESLPSNAFRPRK